jgi:hypothetical protein
MSKPMIKQTQADAVLDHLLQFGSITSIEAIDNYKITRLSAVIHNLRHRDGIKIDTERVKQKAVGVSGTEYASFGRFTLVKQNPGATA